MRTISILNLKGGVAKTFTAANMAYELMKRGYKVLLIDNDKQGNLSKAYGRYDAESVAPITRLLSGDWVHPDEIIQQTDYEGIDIVTANMSLFGATWNLTREENENQLSRYEQLKNAKTEYYGDCTVWGKYDYCIIDNPPEEQKAIADKVAAGEDVRAKEIAAKVAEKTAAKAAEDAEQAQRDYEKQQEESDKEIEKAERKREEAEEKAKEAEIAAQHAKVLREWVKESVSAATKAAADAVLKVSETDTPQQDWNNTEWVVFTAREIMQQADKVSEDDLYLLHEIMIRCQTQEQQDAAGAEQIAGQMSIKDYQKGGQAGNEQTAAEKEE